MASGIRNDSVCIPSLRLIRNDVEEAENNLHDILNDSIEGDFAALQTHVILLKSNYQIFKRASMELESRYRAISSKWESHQTRCSRQQLQSTVNQRLKLLSEVLQRADVECKFSNLNMNATYASKEQSEPKVPALENVPPTSSPELVETRALALETGIGRIFILTIFV